MAKATTEEEAIADPNKKEIFNKFMYDLPMCGTTDDERKLYKRCGGLLANGTI